MSERVTGVTRRPPPPLAPWVRPAGFGVAAVACAAVVTVAGGPARFAAGLVLALYLPGHLTVLALRRGLGRDGVLGPALAVPLSIAVTTAAGLLTAAAGGEFQPRPVAWLLAAVCVALSTVAALVSRPGPAPRAPSRTPTPRYWWALLPALVLSGVLAVQVVAATRHRSPDSYYTEFGLTPAGSVEVRSRERTVTRYRFEVRTGDAVRRSAGFTLRPGERLEFPLTRIPGERPDVRLYRADEQAPYRRLTP